MWAIMENVLSNIPPAEAEERHYAQLEAPPMAA
jgi:hypothetical protein